MEKPIPSLFYSLLHLHACCLPGNRRCPVFLFIKPWEARYCDHYNKDLVRASCPSSNLFARTRKHSNFRSVCYKWWMTSLLERRLLHIWAPTRFCVVIHFASTSKPELWTRGFLAVAKTTGCYKFKVSECVILILFKRWISLECSYLCLMIIIGPKWRPTQNGELRLFYNSLNRGIKLWKGLTSRIL